MVKKTGPGDFFAYFLPDGIRRGAVTSLSKSVEDNFGSYRATCRLDMKLIKEQNSCLTAVVIRRGSRTIV